MGKTKQKPFLFRKTELDKHRIDIAALSADFSHWYKEVLTVKGRELTTYVSSEMPRYFRGNQNLVRYLFFAAGRNSLLYLGGGAVYVTFEAERFAGQRYAVSFNIDVIGGNGIPPAKEKELFQPANMQPKRDGFSLRSTNLFYARMIARSFGGDIQIENRFKIGTSYLVTLRLLSLPQ